MNQTTIEKANCLVEDVKWLAMIIERSSPKNRKISGIGIGHITTKYGHDYYQYKLYESVNNEGSCNSKLYKAIMETMHNEALRLLEEAEVELISIGVVTIRETPKVKTSKLKKILTRIF